MNNQSGIKSNIDFSKIVLDSQFEAVFDSITQLVAKQLEAPVALITFVDYDSIWIHSEVGYSGEKVVSNNKKFCGMFPRNEQFIEIFNTDLDELHREHDYLIDGIKAKYYAAARIKLPLGEVIGLLCIFDIHQRSLSDKQREFLIDLAGVIEKIMVTKSFHNRIS